MAVTRRYVIDERPELKSDGDPGSAASAAVRDDFGRYAARLRRT